jgi:D-glycero-alpha-D-manno-heptose 1-phosphate guanylyltransferase
MMEAIVLAGGFGTRLRSVVPDLPKPMAPVNGRPFLELLLTSLSRKGFHRVVLSLGYMAEKITGHFGSSYAGMELLYAIESTPMGTGGAIRQASQHCTGSHYYVFNGDSYLDLEVAQVEAWWQRNRAPIIVARVVPDTARYGRLETHGNQVIAFTNQGTPGSGLINGGCYVFDTDQLLAWPLGQVFSIETDYFPDAVKKRRFDAFLTQGQFIDIGVPEDYERAQTELLGLCR